VVLPIPYRVAGIGTVTGEKYAAYRLTLVLLDGIARVEATLIAMKGESVIIAEEKRQATAIRLRYHHQLNTLH